MAISNDLSIGDPKTYGDPAYWIGKLSGQLDDDADRLKLYDDYYSGKHRLAFATEQFRSTFGQLFRAFSDNFCAIPVDAPVERLKPQGFRIPLDQTDAADPIEEITTGDAEADDIWQANDLDAESQVLHTEALIHGKAYTLVQPGEEYPQITVESALEMTCVSAPGYRKRRLAAFKRWRGDDGHLNATLYLPDAIYKLRSDKPVDTKMAIQWSDVTWEKREVEGEEFPIRNELGVVPVVPFPNKPRVTSAGESEIAQIIPIQDAVNKLFMDMLVASEFAGMKQRVITGVSIPTDPESGQPIKIDWAKMVKDHVWQFSDENAKVTSLDESNLSNYVAAIAMAIQHIASRTRIPPHYFLASMGNFPSGEALKSAEAGLVAKTHRMELFFGESWEETIRLSFLAMKNEAKAKAAKSAETIWGDAESHDESAHMDSLTKLQSLGVPEEFLWERAGFSPEEIRRNKQLKAAAPPPPLAPAPVIMQPAPTQDMPAPMPVA